MIKLLPHSLRTTTTSTTSIITITIISVVVVLDSCVYMMWTVPRKMNTKSNQKSCVITILLVFMQIILVNVWLCSWMRVKVVNFVSIFNFLAMLFLCKIRYFVFFVKNTFTKPLFSEHFYYYCRDYHQKERIAWNYTDHFSFNSFYCFVVVFFFCFFYCLLSFFSYAWMYTHILQRVWVSHIQK